MTILRCSYVVDTNAVLMGDAGEVSSILLEAVQQVLGVWTDADPSKVISTRINTAMTNYVYKMQWIRPTVSPYIIMRLYGKSGHFLDKQKEEEAALVLSEEGLIPRWLAIFGNGRMEEFIPNTTISAAEFRQESVYEMVAWNLRKLHDTMPIITKRTTIQAHDALWERLEFWRQHAQESLQQLLSKGSLHHHQHYDTIRQIDQWGVLSATVLESLRSSTGHYPKSEVIFGHCDLHHGNLLRRIDTGEIIIIDYEFAMPTSREFDLANVVCEFAYDYESTTPEVPNRANRCTDEQLRRLVKAYMGYDDDTDSKEVDSLMERIIMNRPIPHLFWGYWCLIEVAQKWEHQSGNYDFIRSAYWRFVQFLELSGN